jgi:adenosine deaminase
MNVRIAHCKQHGQRTNEFREAKCHVQEITQLLTSALEKKYPIESGIACCTIRLMAAPF